MEVSGKTGKNIRETFNLLAEDILYEEEELRASQRPKRMLQVTLKELSDCFPSLILEKKNYLHFSRLISGEDSLLARRLSPIVFLKCTIEKLGHKLDGIGVGRTKTFPYSSDSAYMRL